MRPRQNRQTRSQVRSLLSRLDKRASDPPLLERCEPRHLLSSAFLYESITEFIGPLNPTLAELVAPEDARHFGAAVTDLGDVNGDGVPDFVVGAPGIVEDGQTLIAGKAFVFSGSDFSHLFTLTDGVGGFGGALAPGGDLNDDGVPDILVGSPHAESAGAVYAYSGADRTLIFELTGSETGDHFGHALVQLHVDLDSDGRLDFAIGAPGDGVTSTGSVTIALATGAVHSVLHGETPGDEFGFALGAISLSLGNLLIGAPGVDNGALADAGKAYVYDLEDGTLAWSETGPVVGSRFGEAVAGQQAGTTPNSFAVGAPRYSVGEFNTLSQPDRGRVYRFDQNGTLRGLLTGQRAHDRLGASLQWVNVVLSGNAETVLLVGEPGDGVGGGMELYRPGFATFGPANPARSFAGSVGGADLGQVVGAIGDVQGLGLATLFAAMPGQPRNGVPALGAVWLVSQSFVRPIVSLEAVSQDGASITGVPAHSSGRDVWVASDGEAHLFSGLIQGATVWVNSSGRVLVRNENGGASLWNGTELVDARDLIGDVVGPDLDEQPLDPRGIGDGGQMIFTRNISHLTTSAWVLEDGVLRYLWDGAVEEINASGAIIGTRLGNPGSPNITVLRRADGTTIDIPNFFNAGAINDPGVVAGMDPAGNLAVWHNGVVTSLGSIAGWSNPVPLAINARGEIIGFYTAADETQKSFFYSPETGVVDIGSLTVAGSSRDFDSGAETGFLELLDIDDQGRIFGKVILHQSAGGFVRPSAPGFVLIPQAPGPFTSGAAPVPAATPNGIAVAGVNANGEPILFQQSATPSGWTAVDVAAFVNAPVTHFNAITFHDPKDNRTHIAAATTDGLILGHRGRDGVWTFRNLNDELNIDDELIVTDVVHLQTTDNTINIAGLSADGELIMFFQTGATNPDGSFAWQFTNLYDDHLDVNGVERPRFAGDLISYTTAWNALNFAGIDENGDIQVVWWAPDLANGLWTANNLSEAAGTPRVTGGLSVYLTPWFGINLAAANASGEVVVTWWVPQFGGDWAVNNLTQETGGPALRPATMTAYTSPWGALNIVGLDDAGEVRTYWWVPPELADGQDVWRIANLTTEATGTPIAFDPAAQLRGLSRPGNLNVFGTMEDDEVVRLFWTPDQGWLFENLSTAVAVA